LPVTLIGMGYGGRATTIEDESCADYIEHLLTGKAYDHLSVLWSNITDPDIAASLDGDVDFKPREDIIIALQRDLFDFVLVVENPGGDHIVARRIDV
jgi:phosphosulfolactate phosphohydrolase-like enzyme